MKRAVSNSKSVYHKNVVGKLINFRGLVYAPVNENGVVFLFGKVAADLNMYVETIRPGFPDCVAKRYVGNGKWEEVRIEFEFRSSGFVQHNHNPTDCDAIVCWDHDWLDCPKHIEIIDLQEVISKLPNQVIEEPDKVSQLSDHNIEDHFKGKESMKGLYDQLHFGITKIDKAIWRKIGQYSITYYSPERVFAYVRVQKSGLDVTLFTGGRNLGSVEQLEYKRGGEKWGWMLVKSKRDIAHSLKALSRSRSRVLNAVHRGEKTGWFAELD
jgi:hypothetical protein